MTSDDDKLVETIALVGFVVVDAVEKDRLRLLDNIDFVDAAKLEICVEIVLSGTAVSVVVPTEVLTMVVFGVVEEEEEDEDVKELDFGLEVVFVVLLVDFLVDAVVVFLVDVVVVFLVDVVVFFLVDVVVFFLVLDVFLVVIVVVFFCRTSEHAEYTCLGESKESKGPDVLDLLEHILMKMQHTILEIYLRDSPKLAKCSW